MSGTPITLAQAQLNASAAQTALNGAISTYITDIVTLEGQLDSGLAAHQLTFTTTSLGGGEGVEVKAGGVAC